MKSADVFIPTMLTYDEMYVWSQLAKPFSTTTLFLICHLMDLPYHVMSPSHFDIYFKKQET